MVEHIATYSHVGEIIIVDNGSTYEPLLKWYHKQTLATVIYCDNLGHAGAWISGIVTSLGSKFYVVTDADLGLESTPTDTLLTLKSKLIKQPYLKKIGLGLNWQIVNENSPYYERLNSLEKNRWISSRVIDDVYVDVAIDTTFAMYNCDEYFIGGGSLSGEYIARHYPWELALDDNNEEFKYYLKRAKESCSYKRVVKPND